MKLPSLDQLQIKHTLTQQQQYQDGHDLVVLADEGVSESEGDTLGGGETSGTSESTNWSTGTSQSRSSSSGRTRDEQYLHETVSEARAAVAGEHSGTGGGTAQSSSQSSSWSRHSSHGRTITRKQTLIPRLKWRDVITSVQFFTHDELVMMEASRISRLHVGQALMYVAAAGVMQVKVPRARNPFALTPKHASRKHAAYRDELRRRPEYDDPQVMLRERQALMQELLRRLRSKQDRRPLNDGATPPPPLRVTAPVRSLKHQRAPTNGARSQPKAKPPDPFEPD